MAEIETKKFATVMFSIFLLGLIGNQIIQLVTLTHEGFHTIILTAMGCKPKPGAYIYGGATQFDCRLSDAQWIIAALAGPIGSFCLALYLWYNFGKDSWIRFPALFGMLYSSLPSLYSKLPGSDMYVAVQHGFPEWIGFLIWVITSGIATYALLCEIEERDILKKFVKR